MNLPAENIDCTSSECNIRMFEHSKTESIPFVIVQWFNWSSVEGKTESSSKLPSLLRPLVVDTSSCFFSGTTHRWPTHIVSSHSFKRCCVWELFLILFSGCWGRKYPKIWSFISFCTGIWGGSESAWWMLMISSDIWVVKYPDHGN